MELHPEGSAFPNFPSSHSPEVGPSASQSVLNASVYTLTSEQRDSRYISSQRPLRDSTSRYHPKDNPYDQTLTQVVATSYPESSQRTMMHNSPHLSDYDARDFQSTDVRNEQAAVYANIGNSDLDHIPSDLHFSTTVRHTCMSERDILHYQQGPSVAPSSHHLDYGSNPANPGDQMSYPMSCEMTHSDRAASRAPPTASKRPRLSMATAPHARHHPGYGPGSLLLRRNLNVGSVHLDSSAAVLSSPLPSIPMSNNLGELKASLNAPYARPHCSSGVFPRATSDPQALVSTSCPGSPEAFDDLSSSCLAKKKRSKMHECEVCGKMFPRPSGLQTHMNTHNNVKPFPCGYPGCNRTFTVRSNAKRHLRTHGVVPVSSFPEPPAGPYVIDFSAPTVIGLSAPTPQATMPPLKLRWMPPSLMSMTNIQKLRSLSDGESDSDDPDESSTTTKWRSALSIPLRSVVPSLEADDAFYEERNSYLDANSYPYHPSQV